MSCWFALCLASTKIAAYGVPCGPLCQSACSCRWQVAHRASSGSTSACLRRICSGVSPRECSHTRCRFFACMRSSALKELPWHSLHLTFRWVECDQASTMGRISWQRAQPIPSSPP